MSVTTQKNISQQLELAVKTALIALGSGMTEDDVYYNCFQVATEDPKREFPQVVIQCAPDVPQGFQDTTRKAQISIIVFTYQAKADDPYRDTLATIYGQIRAMVDAANNATSTWASANLPSAWHFGGFMIQESGLPYYDGQLAGIALQLEAEFCAP